MANFYSDNYTDAFIDIPKEFIQSGENKCPLKVNSASFSLSAALTTSDSLYICKLPKGAILHEVILYSTDMGTGGDFNMGWDAGANSLETADADGIFAAVDVNAAAAVHRMTGVAATAATGMLKEFADEVNLIIVPSESGTATSGTVKVTVMWSI